VILQTLVESPVSSCCSRSTELLNYPEHML
jgi:hypothetical protein